MTSNKPTLRVIYFLGFSSLAFYAADNPAQFKLQMDFARSCIAYPPLAHKGAFRRDFGAGLQAAGANVAGNRGCY